MHDLREDGLSAALLEHLLERVPVLEVLNRRSTTWRNLPEEDKQEIDANKARELIMANPTLLKRPLLDIGDTLRVGYRDGDYDDLKVDPLTPIKTRGHPMLSFAFGIGTQNTQGDWLEIYYPAPLLKPEASLVEAIGQVLEVPAGNSAVSFLPEHCATLAEALKAAGQAAQAELVEALAASQRPLVATFLEHDAAPQSVPEVYLKLHLLSHRLVKPHGVDLTGMFGLLRNVAWTSEGPIDIDELPARRLKARLEGRTLSVDCVDKFPKMTDYVVPSGVRIGDTARVRLGAYLGEGTTVMHEGFVNFNAGTEGPGMIEGRISAGVVVGKGSDLGGGCSTMGTLSGGGNLVIKVGEGCLIGANAGIGIPLGDRCTVEAGLYITAGAKVTLLDDQGQVVKTVAARELAGHSDLLLRRNSQNGRIECLTNKSAIALNEALHAHN